MMTSPKIELYERQHDFFLCEDRFAAFIGGIGSGKTFVGCLWALTKAVPGSVGMVVAPTYKMLADVSWQTMVDIGKPVLVKALEGKMQMTARGGGKIIFRSSDKPDKLRGANLDWVLIDEASLCPPKTWDILLGRVRGHGTAAPIRIVTTPKGRNWLYERQHEMTIFKAATRENPFLDPGYIEALERAYTGNFAKQELLGDFVGFDGLVYDNFDRNVHVRKRNPKEMVFRVLALDEGFTNPAVIADMGMDGDGRVHVFREWYERGKLQEDVVKQVKSWHNEIKPRTIVVDSSAAGLIAALNGAGMSARGHDGRVNDGIAQIRNALKVQADGKPRFSVDPSCVRGISEFESYIWREGKDEVEKQNDHSMDAYRYGYDIMGIPDPRKLIDFA